MINLDLAKRFADNHQHLEFDAVIIDAEVAGGRVHGPIYLDTKGRFENGTVVTTSDILGSDEGGRIIVTRNSRYLVQMAPETEEARREDSLEPPADWVHANDEALDALAAGDHVVAIDRYAHADGSRECRPVGPATGPYSIGSDRVNGLSKLIEECGEVVQAAGKVIGLGSLGPHWDGTNLETRLEEELADLLAAADFVIVRNGLDRRAIEARRVAKRDRFETWHANAQVPV